MDMKLLQELSGSSIEIQATLEQSLQGLLAKFSTEHRAHKMLCEIAEGVRRHARKTCEDHVEKAIKI